MKFETLMTAADAHGHITHIALKAYNKAVNKASKTLKAAATRYALSNTSVKIDDIIAEYSWCKRIRVTEILGNVQGIMFTVTYVGVVQTNKGTDRKDGQIREISRSMTDRSTITRVVDGRHQLVRLPWAWKEYEAKPSGKKK